MGTRIDNYQGSQDAYIEYLERHLTSLRDHHSTCHIANPNHFKDTGPSVVPTVIAPFQGSAPATSSVSRKRPQDHEFIEYRSPPSPKRRQNAHQLKVKRWEKVATTLVAETPRACDWKEILKKKGIYDIMNSGNAITYLLDTASTNTPAISTDLIIERPSATNILGRIQQYVQAAVCRESSASVALTLANFQKFLALSACAVLKATGTQQSDVVDVVGICVGNGSTDYCLRMLRVVVYMNELLDTLYMHGWGFRACELLLLWNRSPTYFYHMASAGKDGLRYLQTELCTSELTVSSHTTTPWTPFFVPSLVENILGKHVHVAKIAHILGYKYSDILKPRVNPARFEGVFLPQL